MLNRFTLNTPLGNVHLLWETGATTLSEIQLPGAKNQTSAATDVDRGDIPPAIAERIDKLDAYFHGEAVTFTPTDLDGLRLTPFTRRVYEHVMSIPAGETRTYGEVAEAIGKPGAARAVGNAMANNPVPLLMPCHRVVATNSLGGFTSGLHHKRHLLDHELKMKDLFAVAT